MHLSIYVIKQEYPDFELVSCLGILLLSKEEQCIEDEGNVCSQEVKSFSRLSKAFSLDNDQLVEDFHVLKPLARRIFTREDAPNMVAWHRAVQQWQSGRPAPPMSIHEC